jgi:hypothetical protein
MSEQPLRANQQDEQEQRERARKPQLLPHEADVSPEEVDDDAEDEAADNGADRAVDAA